MKQKLSQQITYWLGIVIIGLVVGLGLQFVQAGWTNPTTAPPDVSGMFAPLNTGNVGQAKNAGLVLNPAAGTSGLIVRPVFSGSTLIDAAIFEKNANIGIGTVNPNPARKLHVKATNPDIVRFEGDGQYLDITDIGNAIRVSTDGTGPFGIRTKGSTGGDQVAIDTSGKMIVEGDVCSTNVGKCLSSVGGGVAGYEIKKDTCSGHRQDCAVDCSSGKMVLGGGCSNASGLTIEYSRPKTDGTGWECLFDANINNPVAYAICVNK